MIVFILFKNFFTRAIGLLSVIIHIPYPSASNVMRSQLSWLAKKSQSTAQELRTHKQVEHNKPNYGSSPLDCSHNLTMPLQNLNLYLTATFFIYAKSDHCFYER